jgi:hypothetical protein
VDPYNYGLNIIVGDSRNANYGNLLTQSTEPSGITYITKDIIALTTDNVATATKLQTARTISLSGDVSGSASFDGSANATINATLSNSGVTAGTYPKVTVDSKGRVTAGQSLSASDIPNLDWSKITSGKPTTLSGYGITDGVQNAGGTPSIQAGTDSSKPSAGVVGRIYVATDTKKIYRDSGTSWDVIGTINWSDITGKPTTLAGYGITDATPSSHIGSGGSAHANATPSTAGFMSASDKAKLDGIAAGAEVNQNAFSIVKVGAALLVADTKQDTIEISQGNGITLTPDSINDVLTISANVFSVNGKTGDVSLIASDVGAETPSGAQAKADTAEQNAKSYADSTFAKKQQGQWIAPTLLNGWVNFGSSYPNASYFMNEFGIVILKGLVKSGTVGNYLTNKYLLNT